MLGVSRTRPHTSPKRIAVGLLCLAALVVLFWLLPIAEWLVSVSVWLKTRGAGGAALVTLLYAPWLVVCLPSTPVELLIGSTYGFGWGVLMATIGKPAGCNASFALGRGAARGWVSSWLSRQQGGRVSRTLRALDVAIAAQGWRIVLPFQFAFVPVALKNYGLSICDCEWRVFAWTNFVAEFPSTLVFVYAGSAARNLADALEGGGEGGGGMGAGAVVALVLGGLGCVATVLVVKRYVGRALAQLEAEAGDGAEAPLTARQGGGGGGGFGGGSEGGEGDERGGGDWNSAIFGVGGSGAEQEEEYAEMEGAGAAGVVTIM